MTHYLKEQLREALSVVDTCLACIYDGKLHMYRPLAGQLRLLLCDSRQRQDNSLLAAVYPNLKVSCLEPIGWSSEGMGLVRMEQRVGGTNRIAQMPIEITQYANGLAVADLLMTQRTLLPIADWSKQRLTFHPARLDIKTVIRAVADKGGGAHVDANASPELRLMYELTPTGRTFAEMFIIALGRFVQRTGEHLFDYEGCRVPVALTIGTHHKYNLLAITHKDSTDP